MLLINDFRNYIQEIKDTNANIARNESVIDDSQILKFLEDIPNDGKYIVIGILPAHNPKGDIDDMQSIDRCAILILKKVTRSDQDQNIFLNTIAEAQTVARAVVLKMVADQLKEETVCGIMKYLLAETINVDPIWALAGCDGYEINFNLQTIF